MYVSFCGRDDSNIDTAQVFSTDCGDQQGTKHNLLFEVDENLVSPQCNETHLCDLAWLAPLTVQDADVVVRCFLTNPREIQEASLIIHSRGFGMQDQKDLGDTVTDLPNGVVVKEKIVINNVPLDMPFWLVNGFQNTDYSFLTDSEFKRFSVIKVYNISQSGLSKICPDPCSELEIRGSLLLPDRVLLLTCFGVQELQKEISTNSYQPKIAFRHCIRKLIGPPQAFPGAIKVLAIRDSPSKVYISDVSSGMLRFHRHKNHLRPNSSVNQGQRSL
ncbi:uncharacterized protein LOC114520176 [Dendronephthya gigantea]|uniref:uncharacterized protein LOC114520176 n=1 Tax=Dendronephthya gigantea TaxID=151771 RepID=UPI00106B456E|nr:uncharacterized protein LOC114520176 [Dendronephthya gigantea]